MILEENGIAEGDASLSDECDYCIEMETGTGKTLVYLRTVFELFQHYGFARSDGQGRSE